MFLGYFQINRKYNIKCNFLDILQIRQSVTSVWRDILYKSLKPKTKHTDIVFISDKMFKPISLNTRAIYNVLTDKKQRATSYIEEWSENYPCFHTAQKNLSSNIFRQPFSITRETKLQTFQYKLIHLLITCQFFLLDMKLVANAICLHCQETDNITHFFLFCPKENQFWNTFFTWWNNLGDIQIPTQCEWLCLGSKPRGTYLQF